MDLGEFGVRRDPVSEDAAELDTFRWFGSLIRVRPVYDDLELIDLLEYANAIEVNGYMALTATKRLMELVVVPEDFEGLPTQHEDGTITGGFWALARENHQQAEDLGTLWRQIVSFATGRPTQRPTASSGGPQPTGESSQDEPSSPVSAPNGGRPDLQLIHDVSADLQSRIRAEIAAAG
jgi:hypothetical protein